MGLRPPLAAALTPNTRVNIARSQFSEIGHTHTHACARVPAIVEINVSISLSQWLVVDVVAAAAAVDAAADVDTVDGCVIGNWTFRTG